MNQPIHHIVTLEVPTAHLERIAAEIESRWERTAIQLERPNHDRAWIEIYFEDSSEAEIFRAATATRPDILATAIRRENPRVWQTFWRYHFHATRIGQHLQIIPVWEKDTADLAPRRKTIWLDPGLSFGTGDHFTTRFCLERIDAIVPGGGIRSMLDVGTGSSILAMAARMLGVQRVLGVDNDAIALEQARENLRLNNLEGQVELEVSDILDHPPQGAFDLVCANVYTTVLIALAPALTACTKKHLVLSGIRDPELDEVAAAFVARGMTERFRDGNGEWGGLAFEKSKTT